MGRPKGSKNKAKTYASKEEVQLIIDEKLSEKEALMKELSIVSEKLSGLKTEQKKNEEQPKSHSSQDIKAGDYQRWDGSIQGQRNR